MTLFWEAVLGYWLWLLVGINIISINCHSWLQESIVFSLYALQIVDNDLNFVLFRPIRHFPWQLKGFFKFFLLDQLFYLFTSIFFLLNRLFTWNTWCARFPNNSGWSLWFLKRCFHWILSYIWICILDVCWFNVIFIGFFLLFDIFILNNVLLRW